MASASVRREKILQMLGVKFVKIVSDVDENLDRKLTPLMLCKELAKLKAEDVAKNCDEKCIVIGADTFVCLDNKIIGKPRDVEEARFFMQKLSGRTHSVYTGLAVHYKKETLVSYGKAKVTFDEIDKVQIDQYVMTKEPYDKAGGYALQGLAGQFITKIYGDWFAVVGLPVKELADIIRKIL